MYKLRHMTLAETLNKIKYYPDLTKDTFVVLVVILVAFGSFLAGRYAAIEEGRVSALRILDNTQDGANQASIVTFQVKDGVGEVGTLEPSQSEIEGMYVGAKSGKTYYLPWCAGVKRIKEENKIWFATEVDAKARGYSPTLSCNWI